MVQTKNFPNPDFFFESPVSTEFGSYSSSANAEVLIPPASCYYSCLELPHTNESLPSPTLDSCKPLTSSP